MADSIINVSENEEAGWLILSFNYEKKLDFLKKIIDRYKNYSLIC